MCAHALGELLIACFTLRRLLHLSLHLVQILPFFSGERSPGYNDDATASILGLRRSTTRAQLMRAGMESVCLRLAAVVELMCGGRNDGVAREGRNEKEDESCFDSRNGTVAVQQNESCDDTVESEARDGEMVESHNQPCYSRSLEAAPVAPSTAGSFPLVRGHAKVITSGRAMAESSLWKQILADALGRHVQDSGRQEETSLGVAVLLSSMEHRTRVLSTADAGAGATDRSGTDGAGSGTRVADVYKPNDEAFRRYSVARANQERVYASILGGSGSDVDVEAF